MYALCPNCQHTQQISRKRLKKTHGRLSCPECKQQFDGYLTLSKKPPRVPAPEKPEAKTLIPTKAVADNAKLEITALIDPHNEITEESQAIEETEQVNEDEIELFDWQKPKVAYHPDRWLLGVLLGFFLLFLFTDSAISLTAAFLSSFFTFS